MAILVVDDDPNDQALMRHAFYEIQLTNTIYHLHDGDELLDYLYRRGRFASDTHAPRPGLILLDWHMPRVDGRAVLRAIRSNAAFRDLPILLVTGSEEHFDTATLQELGVQGVIRKPLAFADLVEIVKRIAIHCFKKGDATEETYASS